MKEKTSRKAGLFVRGSDGIGGLRAAACLGIVVMHVFANSPCAPSEPWYARIVGSFTDLVFLFMVISGYGMCCGYYKKIMTQQISMEDFYRRRYSRVLPFFAFLVLLDLIVSPSLSSLCEGFADLTLLFGFFPEKEIRVVGVGWYLGLTFAFYLIFPFFCVLLKNRKRAWASMVILTVLNRVCDRYFHLGRTNLAFSLCYFMAGGMIFLYREELTRFSRKYGWIVGLCAAAAAALYFMIGSSACLLLILNSALVVFAIGRSGGLLCSRAASFFGALSMEIYLSHMAVFRAAERLRLTTLFSNVWLQQLFLVLFTFLGSAAFAFVWNQAAAYLASRVSARRNLSGAK